MKTLAEEYVYNQIVSEALSDKTGYGPDETKGSRIAKYAGAAVLGGAVGVGGYYLYRKYKAAKMKADMEKDPSKKNALNVKANEIKQAANKKKMEDQKKQQLQKKQRQGNF